MTRKMNNSKKDRKKLTKLLKLPIRLLAKVRDFYMQSITECSGQFDHCNAMMGCPSAPQIPSAFSRSLSTSSTISLSGNEDYRELVRAASASASSNFGKRIDQLGLVSRKDGDVSPAMGSDAVTRSRSVGICRIDEEKPCEFDEEDLKVVKRDVYPRSRSYAVTSRRTVMS